MRVVFLLLIPIFCVLALPLMASKSAVAADSLSVGIRLVVHIMDIDQSQKTARLTLIVFIDKFPYNESHVGVSVGGAGSAYVSCNQSGLTPAG